MNQWLTTTKAYVLPGVAVGLIWVFGGLALATSNIQPFSDSTLESWKERSFLGNTQYQVTTDKGIRVLKGTAQASASLLYKEGEISLDETPTLSWYWKIDNVFTNTDEQSRDGDDFAARVYVAYRYGRFPWQTYAINYVWASHTPMNNSWTSPYTKKSKLIAIQSGDSLAGQWQRETRNVANDFATLFGIEVKKLDGIAVMVDADNTGKAAVAHFGAIQFSSEQ